ncbi:MAG: hypothetical protein V4714_17560 [Bacteroidota bacterium]
MQQTSTYLIEKETITRISFLKDDVLVDSLSKQVRLFNLKRAQTLGNGYKRKVKINFFTANHEAKQVETTVWAVGSFYVSLKGGINIPINAISEIQF